MKIVNIFLFLRPVKLAHSRRARRTGGEGVRITFITRLHPKKKIMLELV
jgi:hypothetical protein